MSIIKHKLKRKNSKKRHTLTDEVRKTTKILIITLSIMIFVLGITFFATTNQTAQKGYTLQQIKLQNEYLKNQSTAINTQIINSKAFNSIEEEGKIENMATIENHLYVTEEDNKVK